MNKVPFYTSVEVQLLPNGNVNCLYDHYTDLSLALAKYYTVCAAAVRSELTYHAAYLFDDQGIYRDEAGTLYRRIFDRREDKTTHIYVTIENQVRTDESKGLLYDSFNELKLGQQKYHYICAAACVSDIPYHAGFLLDTDGVVINCAIWDRRVDEVPVEPEPEEEETPEESVEPAVEGGEA